jgi:hypothetical protein
MTVAAAGAAHRASVLRALDVTPWVRRDVASVTGDLPVADAASATAVVAGHCVVLIPAASDPRALDLLGRALNAGGAALARAARISVSGGKLAGPAPQARAYLAFGEAQAHALGRELPAAAMSAAHISLVDEPSLILAGADGKRRLWSALRQVRRALASTDGD